MSIDLDYLMKQSAKGDHIAFRDLASYMGPRLFAFAYRLMGNNRAAAEDAVQETLIKLWVHAASYKDQGKAESYINTVLYRCCMDLHRKAKPDYAVPDHMPSNDPGAASTLYAQERHATLMNAINGLPERQRTAILLSYFGETSNRKIGEALNVSEKAVESLLIRARATLAKTVPNELIGSAELDNSVPAARKTTGES